MKKLRKTYCHRNLLNPEMSEREVILVMFDGKPATLALLLELIKTDKSKTMSAMFVLDSLGIYGSSIFWLYADLCQEDSQTFFDCVNELKMDLLGL